MALTKSSTVIVNDVAAVAGAGDQTSSDQDLTAVYHATMRLRITNGGTGPTVAGKIRVQISEDTTTGNYMTIATIFGTTVASDVVEQFVDIPHTAQHLRTIYGSNTAQNVTVRAVLDKVTGY